MADWHLNTVATCSKELKTSKETWLHSKALEAIVANPPPLFLCLQEKEKSQFDRVFRCGQQVYQLRQVSKTIYNQGGTIQSGH